MGFMVRKWLLALRSPQSFVGRVDTLIFRWLEMLCHPSLQDLQRSESRHSGRAPEEEKTRGLAACVVKLLSMFRNGGMYNLKWWSGVWPLALFQARFLLLWP